MSKTSRHYLPHNGHILEIFVKDSNCLRIKLNSIDLSIKKWKVSADFAWKSKVKVELLSVAEILEESTCRRIPVALIALNNAKNSQHLGFVCYLIYVNIDHEKCVALKRFSLDPKMLNRQSGLDLAKKVHILDGPSVLLSNESQLFLFSGKDGSTLNHYSFPLSSQCKPCRSSLCQMSFYCSKHICQTKLMFIGISYNKSCIPCQRKGNKAFMVLRFQDGEFINLDPSVVIPVEFHDQLKSVYVNFVKLEDKSLQSSEIYACTQNGFALSLKDGYLLRCVPLDEKLTTQVLEKNEEKIKLHLIESEEKKFIIAEKGQTCVLLDQKLKVQKYYHNVCHLFNGDFIGNGTVQCLLLKSASIEDSEWILDDLNQLCIHSDQQDLSTTKEDTGITHSATKALQLRLQQEQLFLHENKHNLCKKREFITEIVDSQFLSAAGLHIKYHRKKVDLLTLVGEETKECTTLRPKTSQSDTPVIVCGQWQRTYNDRWCVGVEFQWKSEKDAQIWLDMVPAKDSPIPLCLKSKPIICRSEDQGCQSREKRKRVEIPASNNLNPPNSSNNRLEPKVYTTICVTDIPKFLKKSVLVYLNLKWRFLQSDNYSDCVELDRDNDADLSFTENTVYTQHCGNLMLESQAVIQGQHEISFTDCGTQDVFMDHFMEDFNELQRNKLAWKHLQTGTDLVVRSSTVGTLAQLDKLLVDRCGFIFNNHFQCYITLVHVFCNVQIELPPSSQDDCRHMKIYTSSDKDLLLLLHHLYECLPDNIVILPDNNNRKHLREVLTRMHQETSFYSQGIRKLLDDQDSKMSADSDSHRLTTESDRNEDVKKIGERFKRKREDFLDRDKKCVEASDMEEFMAKLTLHQKKTDNCVAMSNSSQ